MAAAAWELFMLGVLLAASLVAGRLARAVGVPELVGEVGIGIGLGPHGADAVPHPEALRLIGELGLLLLLVEAGLDMELSTMRAVGARGVVTSAAAALLPAALGLVVALLWRLDGHEATAVAFGLAPMSTGVVLAVFKAEAFQRTTTACVVIAAALVNDVVALVLLSLLEAIEEPSASNVAVPIASAVAFVTVVGLLAVHIVPRILLRLVDLIPAHRLRDALLFGIFGTTLALCAAMIAGKSSALLGSFLAGLAFSQLHAAREVWHRRVRQLQRWAERIFFSCTIGFSVPVAEFASATVVAFGFSIFGCLLAGKLASGWAGGRMHLAGANGVVGLGMAACGEFNFLLATRAREMDLLSRHSESSLLLCVLLCVVTVPLALRAAIRLGRLTLHEGLAPGGGALYRLDIRALNRWGLLGDLLRVLDRERVALLDIRVAIDKNAFVIYEACLRVDDRGGPVDALLAAIRADVLGVLEEGDNRVCDCTPAHGVEEAGGISALLSAHDLMRLRGLRLTRWVPSAEAPPDNEADLLEQWHRHSMERRTLMSQHFPDRLHPVRPHSRLDLRPGRASIEDDVDQEEASASARADRASWRAFAADGPG